MNPYGRWLSRVTVSAVSALTLGVFAPSPALSSCAGPGLSAPGAETVPEVTDRELEGVDLGEPGYDTDHVTAVGARVGEALVVEGENFSDGECADVSTSPRPGCAASEERTAAPPSFPVRGIQLELRQGTRVWLLGKADASGPEDNFSARWRAVVPHDAAPGPPLLVATEPGGLTVELGLRIRR